KLCACMSSGEFGHSAWSSRCEATVSTRSSAKWKCSDVHHGTNPESIHACRDGASSPPRENMAQGDSVSRSDSTASWNRSSSWYPTGSHGQAPPIAMTAMHSGHHRRLRGRIAKRCESAMDGEPEDTQRPVVAELAERMRPPSKPGLDQVGHLEPV